MSSQAATYAALYATTATSLANSIVDMGDELAARCAALQRNPTAHGCEELAYSFDGARRAVLGLRERLIAEGGGDGR